MKILKKVLIAIAILIAIPLVIAIFVEKEYSVDKEVTIELSNGEVFEYIKLLKNQDNFSKWATMDPDSKKSYVGTDGTVGFVSKWNSENPDVGIGEQEITKIVPNQRVDYELRFIEPFESTSQAFLATKTTTSGTAVTWGFTGKMNYPMNIMLLFMDFETMIGNDFDTGLQNLKAILETK